MEPNDDLKYAEPISFEEAYDIVISSSFPLCKEVIPFTDSSGRVLAEDVTSDMDMPPFDKSTVDGFACRKMDLGSELTIIETIPAGKKPGKTVSEGECARIMTGAPVPQGADCIVMVEEASLLPSGKMKFTGQFTKTNISIKGEDIKKDEVVLKAGKLIVPQDIAVMASSGAVMVTVSRQPVTGVISSGDELVEPGEKPDMSGIRNSNAYQLHAQIRRTGCPAKYYGIARDSEEETLKLVKKAISECDILLLTGGVSMGDFDFIPSVLVKAGIRILFSRVKVQPGKPTTFGIHDKGFVFGLPGNPVSSFVQFELLVRPLIYKLMGGFYRASVWNLPMHEDYTRRSVDRMSFIPVIITLQGTVRPVEYHGSAHINSLSLADGIISVPEGTYTVRKGDVVSVRQI